MMKFNKVLQNVLQNDDKYCCLLLTAAVAAATVATGNVESLSALL